MFRWYCRIFNLASFRRNACFSGPELRTAASRAVALAKADTPPTVAAGADRGSSVSIKLSVMVHAPTISLSEYDVQRKLPGPVRRHSGETIAQKTRRPTAEHIGWPSFSKSLVNYFRRRLTTINPTIPLNASITLDGSGTTNNCPRISPEGNTLLRMLM